MKKLIAILFLFLSCTTSVSVNPVSYSIYLESVLSEQVTSDINIYQNGTVIKTLSLIKSEYIPSPILTVYSRDTLTARFCVFSPNKITFVDKYVPVNSGTWIIGSHAHRADSNNMVVISKRKARL